MGLERFGNVGEVQRVSLLSSPSGQTSTIMFIFSGLLTKSDFLSCWCDQAKVKATLPFTNSYFRIMRALSSALQGAELLGCRAGLRVLGEECPAVIFMSQLTSFLQTPFPRDKDLLNPKQFQNVTQEKGSHSTDFRAISEISVSNLGFCERLEK